MARTSNIFARVEPEVKTQAEDVLNRLGIPMSNAVDMFLRQVILQKGIPFDIKLPVQKPVDISKLSEEEFNKEITKGLDDIENGRVYTSEEVENEMRRLYGI